MTSIFELLEKIRQRPALYLGYPSVTALRHFLVGYKFARQELDIAPTELELEFYHKFQPWLQRHFHLQTANAWDIILLFQYRDEETAFTHFFQLLNLFRSRDKTQDIDPVLLDDALSSDEKVA